MHHLAHNYYHFGLNMKYVLLIVIGSSMVTAMFTVISVVFLWIIADKIHAAKLGKSENYEKPVVRYQNVSSSGDTDILDYRR